MLKHIMFLIKPPPLTMSDNELNLMYVPLISTTIYITWNIVCSKKTSITYILILHFEECYALCVDLYYMAYSGDVNSSTKVGIFFSASYFLI